MTNIERLEAKLNALKDTKNEFNARVFDCVLCLKAIATLEKVGE